MGIVLETEIRAQQENELSAARLRELRRIENEIIRRKVLEQGDYRALAKVVYPDWEFAPFHWEGLKFLNERRFAMLLAPRGFAKTTVFTQLDIIMQILRNPNIDILIASYKEEMAKGILRVIKDTFEQNERFIEIFGSWVGKDVWAADAIIVSKRTRVGIKAPTVRAVGIRGASAVSDHFAMVKADDLVILDNAISPSERRKTEMGFDTACMPAPRPQEGVLHVIGNRWALGDTYEYIGRKPIFAANTLIFPAIDWERYPDTGTIWPKMWPLERIQEQRQNMDPAMFAAHFMNNPIPAQGNLVDKDWLRRFKQEGDKFILLDSGGAHIRTIKKEDLRVYIGVDPGGLGQKHPDYLGQVVLGINKQDRLILSATQVRGKFDDLVRSVVNTYQRWTEGGFLVLRVGVEAVGWQSQFADILGDQEGIPVKKCYPEGKQKIARFSRKIRLFRSGHIFLPEGGLPDLEEQILLAPASKHDDLRDAFVIADDIAMTSRVSFTWL